MNCVLSWVIVIVKPKSWQWPRLDWRNNIHVYIVAIHDVQMVGDRTGAVMIALDWDGILYTIGLTLSTWIPSKHYHPAIDRFIICQRCCTIAITTTLILKWCVLLPSSSTSILQLLFITANNMNTMPMPGRRLKPHSTPQYHLARESRHSYPQTIESRPSRS